MIFSMLYCRNGYICQRSKSSCKINIEDNVLKNIIEKDMQAIKKNRKEIIEGKVGLKELADYALKLDGIKNKSGRQEKLETILNNYIFD